MKSILFAAIGILILQAPMARAAEWRHLHYSDARDNFPASVTEYDASTILREGSRVTVWEQETFETPAFYSDLRPDVKFAKRLKQFDCRARTARILTRILYNSAGQSVLSSSEPYDMTPIAPDTIGEESLKLYCQTASREGSR